MKPPRKCRKIFARAKFNMYEEVNVFFKKYIKKPKSFAVCVFLLIFALK